jgi:NitT/TauT family transport system substrate-binding protein
MRYQRSRREFLGALTLAGAAGSLGLQARPVTAESPPETTRLRLTKGIAGICTAPQWVAEELLRGEGFSDLQYVAGSSSPLEVYKALASGELHISFGFGAKFLQLVDEGAPIVFLAGGHVGCFELFGTDRVRAIRDLKGRTVAVLELGGVEHLFLASMVAYVGLNPRQDINWVTHPTDEAIPLLAEGKIDAYLAFPPAPQELRARNIGHVVVKSSTDRPWSQYFCCLIAGNREFVQKHPIATKRALRALLKAADICAREPERAAQLLVDKGVAKRYDYALQLMKDLPYGRWREYDPEDTLRFYALRLREAGMIKSSPQKIITQATDWRFLNALKKELKG